MWWWKTVWDIVWGFSATSKWIIGYVLSRVGDHVTATTRETKRRNPHKGILDGTQYCGIFKSWLKERESRGPYRKCAFNSETESARTIRTTPWDTDSKEIKIDNCATRSVSNDRRDFIGDLRPTEVRLSGIGGSVGVQLGTIQWQIADDYGTTHTIQLPDSYYVPESPVCLLSPQHWAQRSKKKVWCTTTKEKCGFVLGRRKGSQNNCPPGIGNQRGNDAYCGRFP